MLDWPLSSTSSTQTDVCTSQVSPALSVGTESLPHKTGVCVQIKHGASGNHSPAPAGMKDEDEALFFFKCNKCCGTWKLTEHTIVHANPVVRAVVIILLQLYRGILCDLKNLGLLFSNQEPICHCEDPTRV